MSSEPPETAIQHYDRLLASVYTWMLGGLHESIERNRSFFQEHSIVPAAEGSERALDVGAGPGPQSIALAELGYQVTALDPSEALLSELRSEASRRHLHIEALRDAVPLADRHPGPFSLVTCMTDTLVSLPSVGVARAFVSEAARRLVTGGRLVLTWRDLTRIPEGDARFLPVRSDGDRILVCFLEEVDREQVRVHDLLLERQGSGFVQKVSSYLKLRLAPATVDRWLTDAGFDIDVREEARGMHTRVARRRG